MNRKSIILLISLLLLILILILVVNTIRFNTKQLQTVPIEKIEVSDSSLLHLSQSIQFKTVSYENSLQFDSTQFLRFYDFLLETYPQVNKTLEKRLINEYSILFKWEGRNPNKKPVILMAHYDVVSVDELTLHQWNEDPFSGKIDGNFVWGRGTMDDKLSLIAIMEAVEMLLQEEYIPERTIYIAFGHDEEIGGLNGAVKIADFLKSAGITAEYIIDEGLSITHNFIPGLEKDLAMIGLSEKGYLTVKLSLINEGGHASMPQKETTIDILARAVVRLKENQMPARICKPMELFMDYTGPEMKFIQKMFFANKWLFKGILLNIYESTPSGNSVVRTTTAPTIFQSGIKENTLPSSASATLNYRILPGESVEDVLSHVKDVINDERIVISSGDFYSNPSPVSSTESFGFNVIEKTIKQLFPDVLVSPSLVSGASDSRHYAEISNNIYRFVPQIVTSEDLPRIHGINERIEIDDFKNCCRFYYQLIKNSNQ